MPNIKTKQNKHAFYGINMYTPISVGDAAVKLNVIPAVIFPAQNVE
jgi:hypothetical protein